MIAVAPILDSADVGRLVGDITQLAGPPSVYLGHANVDTEGEVCCVSVAQLVQWMVGATVAPLDAPLHIDELFDGEGPAEWPERRPVEVVEFEAEWVARHGGEGAKELAKDRVVTPFRVLRAPAAPRPPTATKWDCAPHHDSVRDMIRSLPPQHRA